MQPKILTIDAEKLLHYYAKKPGEEKRPYCFDTGNRFFYGLVVKQIDDLDECPLLYQIMQTAEFMKSIKNAGTDIQSTDDWLLDKLIIVDFSTVFIRVIDPDKTMDPKRQQLTDKAKDIIENGFDIAFSSTHRVHMIPFDKSGNMSRTSRITFLNEDYKDELNKRLDLDIDFSGIEVVLSKYYAYRGLYLTSSKRAEDPGLKITEETLVVVKDNRKYKLVRKEGEREVLGNNYETNVPIISGKENSEGRWIYVGPEIKDMEEVETPFDGEGIVLPEYAKRINKALGISGATSFQVRMPFVKGMIHQVDFHEFLKEFDSDEWKKSDSYEYEDAFGIKRDLKKAKILITESMFKAKGWLSEQFKNDKEADPMKYYCGKIEEYGHGLYVSGTDLPYGHSEYTHLTYQMINTLDLTENEFDAIVNKHIAFIKDPKDYLTGWDSSEAYDFNEAGIIKEEPVWKTMLRENPNLEKDGYIAEQLRSTKKGLITKIANGKLVVAGQTRFLCRDLMPMLACLIKDHVNAGSFFYKCLFMRFYMPMEREMKDKYENLKCNGYCAFFRSPHLSRNEQCLLQPYTIPSNKGNDYYFRKDGMKIPPEEEFKDYVANYHKYFGHLTGVVMVPRGSIVPLCLGGADFDGDLVNVIYDENVVEAVKRGCYEEWLFRKTPVIKIPKPKPNYEAVPESVPFEHINDTFSNAIGYLSNAAISIGQKEYESKDYSDKDRPACWKCTFLTGLEIDAAKNGRHPDLGDIVRNKDEFPKADYLVFKDRYEYFRTLPDFKFDRMEISIYKSGSNENKISFKTGTENAKTYECNIASKDHGTKINRLPYLFADEFGKYKKEKKKKSGKASSPFIVVRENKENRNLIRSYLSDCEDVISSYIKYKSLVGSIRFEKNKTRNGEKNLIKLIAKKYDTTDEAIINREIIYGLLMKLLLAIPADRSVGEIQKRFNEYKWQFQPYDKRSRTLEKIIGNGFKASSLNKREKELLFHFGQYGYKMLWHFLTFVNDIRIPPYDEIKEDKKWDFQTSELDKTLDKITKEYFESDLADVEGKLYRVCLHELKDIIENSKLPVSVKIGQLYKDTCNNYDTAKFFWDAFSPDEYKKAEKEADHHAE